MKVAFCNLEDLLKEADDSVRVITLMKKRGSKVRGLRPGTKVLMASLVVVVTAKLPEGMFGEYVYFIGEEMAYSKEKMKELCEKAANAEEEIRKRILESGKQVLNGQYTDGVVLGEKP